MERAVPTSAFSTDVDAVLDAARVPQVRTISVCDQVVKISCPYKSPEDWRDRWIYFVLVDRFNNPREAPRAPWNAMFGNFQGGTLEGLRQQLGYLQRLGVGAIWISPVLQNCPGQETTYHGYGIQHFLKVDPRFASDRSDPDAELRRLVDEAHARGMHVILDIVLNHAGDVFAYDDGTSTGAAAAEWRDFPYPIRWRGADNRPVERWSEAPIEGDVALSEAAAIWPNELRLNAAFRRKGKGGEAGGDFESLKEFVSNRSDVRSALIRCYQHAVAKWDVDGFRIDTLKYIEPDFALLFGNAMREFAQEIGKKNFFTFGEVYDNEQQIARFVGRRTNDGEDMVGVDAALDFPLFFKLSNVVKGFASPLDIVSVFEERRRLEQGVISSHGEAGRYFVTFLDNHDQTQRFLFDEPSQPQGGYDAQAAAALGCLFALQGIPCVYYGTEQGLSGRGPIDQAVREALWGRPNAFDERAPIHEALSRLASVRAATPALRYGRQYFRPVSGDRATFGLSTFRPGILAWSRILNETEIVCALNADLQASAEISILVDGTLQKPGLSFETLFSSLDRGGTYPVERASAIVDGSPYPPGQVTSVRVGLAAGEMCILRPARRSPEPA
ncbi:MAG: alpha-amylase [Cupriavidus sp.]|uniref:alpha-amylase family glycosyl hydrolase n=1 Tax=Methylobacterium sp. TaxID=409 RepID=UPI000C57A8B8|nr:alpha-amylase family glycosyl hydrolase [Methylobacterium sp.]MBP32445.1 alpha-amylase [Methylobacterium sp.]MBU69447.1 alpha-amylase [Cupriavidus sp.]